MKPTLEERQIATKVLEYYGQIANKVSDITEQERPCEWARGAEVWVDLFTTGDPEKEMMEYLEEYRAGHDD